MEQSFWEDRWKQGEIGWHKTEINPFIEQFWSVLSLASGAQVLVPLCGKSLDMLWLAGQGYRVLGVELSELACDAFFAENRLPVRRHRHGRFEAWTADTITILQGDFFDLQASDLVGTAAVYDRAALIALPSEMRRRYVAHLLRVMPEHLPMLVVTIEYDQSKRPGPPFAVSEPGLRLLYEPLYAVELLHTHNALEPNSPWVQMGVTWLEEKVYSLLPCSRQPIT